MKFFYFILLYIISNIKCDEEILEYYKNYTFIAPSSGQKNIYYFYPHYEVGTVNFKIFFSDSSLSCNFSIYDGDNQIDSFDDFYQTSIEHELIIPKSDPKPQILRLEVINKNHNYPYYMYLYNKNYIIPLDISNYYLYQLSLNALEINYEVINLSKDIYL